MERLTDKLVVNNKFAGYCAKSNMQHRISNRNETNDITNTPEIIEKLGKLEDLMEKHNRPTIDSLDNIICAGEILNDLNKEVKASCMTDFINYIKDRVKIEKELGIDLVTLFRAIKNGVYVNGINGIDFTTDVEYKIGDIYIYFYWDKPNMLYEHQVYKLSDYGKTWALTKEELQK